MARLGDHVADEHEQQLIGDPLLHLADLAHLVEPLLSGLLRVGKEVRGLPGLLLVQEKAPIDLLLDKILDLVHHVHLARVQAPLGLHVVWQLLLGCGRLRIRRHNHIQRHNLGGGGAAARGSHVAAQRALEGGLHTRKQRQHGRSCGTIRCLRRPAPWMLAEARRLLIFVGELGAIWRKPRTTADVKDNVHP